MARIEFPSLSTHSGRRVWFFRQQGFIHSYHINRFHLQPSAVTQQLKQTAVTAVEYIDRPTMCSAAAGPGQLNIRFPLEIIFFFIYNLVGKEAILFHVFTLCIHSSLSCITIKATQCNTNHSFPLIIIGKSFQLLATSMINGSFNTYFSFFIKQVFEELPANVLPPDFHGTIYIPAPLAHF